MMKKKDPFQNTYLKLPLKISIFTQWSRIPDHILLEHVLPHCAIDVRLAFVGVPSQKLRLRPEHWSLLENCLKRRHKKTKNGISC